MSVISSGGNKRGRRTDAGYDDRQLKRTEWANLGRTHQGRIPCRIVSEVGATATWTGSGKGEQLWFLGTLATIKVPGEASNGRFALIEFLFPRHASPPLHTHPQDESYIVQEGLLTVQAGEQRFELAPRGGRCPDGGRAYLPRRQQHRACACTEYAGRARTTGARRFGSGSEADTSNERDTTTFA
jgi:hypothetical protein